jgi:dipeptidyl aminopeptidase/acylaminoacyl peptidase
MGLSVLLLVLDMFGAEALTRLVSVSDPRVSGKGVVSFSVTRIDRAKDTYASALFWINSGRRVRLTEFYGSIASPVWSPKGEMLAYVHTVRSNGKSQASVRTVSVYGGGPLTLYTEEDVGFTGLSWVSEDELVVCKREVVARDEGDAKRVSRIRYRLDNEGYFHNRRSHLFRLNVGSRKLRRITEGDFDVGSFSVDAASSRVYFASNMDADAETSLVKHIYEVPLSGGSPKRVVEWSGPINALNLSHKADRLAFLGHDMKHGHATNTKLYVASTTSGKVECMTDGFDRSLENSLNTDVRHRNTDLSPFWDRSGSRVYFVYTDRWITRLANYDFGSSSVKVVDTGKISVEGYHVVNETVYFTGLTWGEPADLYALKQGNGNLRRLTGFGKRSVRGMGFVEPERFTFTASDGEQLDGWFMRASRQPAKGTILEIHGGPRTAYGEVLMFEFQFFVNQGFNVIFCNPRGSSGYGERFALSVVGHYGERDYQDIMEFVEYAASKFNLDRSKLYVTGGSYGGFMTNWIITHTDIFRAAVTQRSISNWVSFYGTSDIGYHFTYDQIGGRPWDDLDRLWDKSPLKYVKNARTPLLIHHAEMDFRCPIEQAEQFFTALRELGREAVFIRVPEEGHELSRSGKPSRRIDRLKQMLNWFESH